ncbi:MAG: helix-turn-helix domain-containing protein, partial [Parvibaculaceae bacterium]
MTRSTQARRREGLRSFPGNSHRLSVFRFLVKAGHDGASVGDIQKGLGIPASTLSHHLARMAKVG